MFSISQQVLGLLPLLSMILADVHLQAVIVLVLLSTKLAINCWSAHMLADNVSHQVIPLGTCLATSARIIWFTKVDHFYVDYLPSTGIRVGSIMDY